MKYLHSISKSLGISEAVFYSLCLRGWQLVSGPITLFLIGHHFTPTQQGFYYTFNSLLLLQIFFEMGLSFVLVQFSSHEFSILQWKKWGGVKGGKKIGRFKEIVKQSFRWYGVFTLLFLMLVIPLGFYFLKSKDTGNLEFGWKLPWALVGFSTSAILLSTPLMAIIEGSGRVKETSLVRLSQSVISLPIAWLVIMLGGGLFNAATVAFVNAFIVWSWLATKNPLLLKTGFSGMCKDATSASTSALSFSWRQEVWPMQWRIAISWISGYFINQLFVPLLFYYQTAEIAGKMGMTLSLANMLPVIGQAWLTSKAPFLGRLVAQKSWKELDLMFFKLVAQSSSVVFLGVCVLAMTPLVFRDLSIFQRLLPPKEIAILSLSAFITHLINCFAQYLRSFKREPMMGVSVIGALLVTALAWYCGKYYSSRGIVISALSLNALFGLPTAVWLWLKYRKLWRVE